jgi:hypothetical protein
VNNSSAPVRRGPWHILALPLAIFIATATGLTTALVGNGWWHWLSWLLLALPLAIIAVSLLGSRCSHP